MTCSGVKFLPDEIDTAMCQLKKRNSFVSNCLSDIKKLLFASVDRFRDRFSKMALRLAIDNKQPYISLVASPVRHFPYFF